MAKQTKGFCKYCGKEYTRSGMVKHLVSCKERIRVLEQAKETTAWYELALYGKYDKDYWLVIQIKESATFKDLDQFIRDIWVECCGHLSAFELYGQRYETLPNKDSFWGEPAKSMNCKLQNVLEQGMQMEYEYDYGSTTELLIEVRDHYQAPNQKDKSMILSRNNPPQYVCSRCGKNIATWIYLEGFLDGDPFWCDECLEKYENETQDAAEEDEEYDFDTDFLSRICNSPRMGVCGYDGSSRYPDQFEPDKIEK